MSKNGLSNSFTIDVEDGISIAMRDAFGITTKQTEQVLRCTLKILDLLNNYSVKATFFTLGKVGEDYPQLIRAIVDQGHELAVHGFNHHRFDRLTPEKAYQEISTAKKQLEDISGKPIYGHRAPAFSVMPATSWALDVIAKAGFVYDSSIMPCGGSSYGWPGFTEEIIKIRTSSGAEIVEIPMSTGRMAGKTIPIGGGSYLRLFPLAFTKNQLRKNGNKRANILYIHPYEVDEMRYPDYYFDALRNQPVLKQLKMRSFWVNRQSVYPKVQDLLQEFTYVPMHELAIQHQTTEATCIPN